MARLRKTVLLLLTVAAGLAVGLVVYVKLFMPGPVQGDLAGARSGARGLRVLFVGNSLTANHDMTGMVAKLAAADPGAPRVFAVRYAPGSTGLDDHVRSDRLRRLMYDVRWDEIVLQERSYVPSSPVLASTVMRFGAEALVLRATAVGARPWLFMTWGYEHGDPGRPDTYDAMQDRIAASYATVGRLLHVRVSPVGRAWQEALAIDHDLDLWDGDGRHPSHTGSFLAACVLYASLTHRSPVASRFDGGISPAVAGELKQVAAAVAP